jgi:hypothetical protein
MMCNLQAITMKTYIYLFFIQYNCGITAQWRVLLPYPYHIHIISYPYHIISISTSYHIHIHFISISHPYHIHIHIYKRTYSSLERLTANGTIPFKDWPTIPLVPQPDLQMWLTVTRATRTRDKTLTRCPERYRYQI